MKSRLKGLLALVLSLVMVFALATNAWATVWIGGTELTSGVAFDGDQGTATYDDTTKTLTLNGFQYECSGHGIESNENLTLQLLGDNKVESNSGGAGIFVDGDTLTITGDGSLEAAGVSYGIANTAGTVIIENATVTATGSNGDGIYANKVTISGGTVTATGSNDYGYGIYALEYNFNGGDITISNGTVTATGGSAGMYADNKATIEGGTVTATGGSAGAGIGADNAITISGADTNVTVGCETGLVADTVSILDDSTVSIDADNTAIDCTTLNMGGNWYQWKGDDNQLHVSSGGDEHELDATKAATTKTLIIEKIVQEPTYTVTFNLNGHGTMTTATQTDITKGETVDEPVVSDVDGWIFGGWYTDDGAWTDKWDFAADTVEDNITLYAKWTENSSGDDPEQEPSHKYPIRIPALEEESKVESPPTFDSGIALSVAVTILSATGGAWLAKKKD